MPPRDITERQWLKVPRLFGELPEVPLWSVSLFSLWCNDANVIKQAAYQVQQHRMTGERKGAATISAAVSSLHHGRAAPTSMRACPPECREHGAEARLFLLCRLRRTCRRQHVEGGVAPRRLEHKSRVYAEEVQHQHLVEIKEYSLQPRAGVHVKSEHLFMYIITG